jgi:membrane protein implicated in regulation of membrane protease activity
MRTDPTLSERDLIGRLGQVITSIPSGGLGEVRLTVGGQQLKYYARSAETLPAGTPVYVIDAPTPTSVEVVSTAPRDDPPFAAPQDPSIE